MQYLRDICNSVILKDVVWRNKIRDVDLLEHIIRYVQVSYLLAASGTVEREFGVYRNVPDNYPKYVVSMDDVDLSRDGIKHRNIREFLLMETWE